VDYLRNGRTKEAARAYGMAHHADCQLESAALMTFACLKAADGEDSDIVEQVVKTWWEMKQPAIARKRGDREMLNCLAVTTPKCPALSPLGRLAWLSVSPQQRSRIGRLTENAVPAWAEPLRSTSNRDGGATDNR